MENNNLTGMATTLDIAPVFQEYEQILISTLAELEKHWHKLKQTSDHELTKRDIDTLDYLNYMLADFKQPGEFLQIEELLIYVRDYCQEKWSLGPKDIKQSGNTIVCQEQVFPLPEPLIAAYLNIDRFSRENYTKVHQKFRDFILNGRRSCKK